MVIILVFFIGVVASSSAVPTSTPLTKRYCDAPSNLALIYNLNEKSVVYSTAEVNRFLEILSNDILNREDFLVLLGDMCRSQSLTLAWLLRQAEKVCPHPHRIRSIVEPSGVVCYQNGDVTDLAKKALKSFVSINKTRECESALTMIQSKCEIEALFNVKVPLVPRETMDTRIAAQTRRSVAAIRCALSRLGSLAPACGSLEDIRTYQLVSELIQKQPFKVRGDVDFETFSDVMN